MNKVTKLILNIIAIVLYGVSLVSFFTDFVYVWILGIGMAGSYKGYEIALNFDGMPQNLGALVPLLTVLGTFIYALVIFFIKLARLKKEPAPKKSSTMRPLLCAIFFVLLPLITMFLSLSTMSILDLPSPKRYGGYYMAVGPYLVAYCTMVGGLILFITESGIFGNSEPAHQKEEAKPQAPKQAKK